MQSLEEHDRDLTATYFATVTSRARELDKGGGLFVQCEDGAWVYRQDEISYFYALAAYRLAVVDAEKTTEEGHERQAENLFCGALRVRRGVAMQECPDVILEAASKDTLHPKTRQIFERAKERCYVKGGSCGKKARAYGEGLPLYQRAVRFTEALFSEKPSEEKEYLAQQDHGLRDESQERFCWALHARPEVILEVVQKEGLRLEVRRIFNKAKRKCYLKRGWHSSEKERPILDGEHQDDVLGRDMSQ